MEEEREEEVAIGSEGERERRGGAISSSPYVQKERKKENREIRDS